MIDILKQHFVFIVLFTTILTLAVYGGVFKYQIMVNEAKSFIKVWKCG